jgi:hypothetical protein
MNLKQSTAYTRLFNMIASSDHHSPLTGAAPVVNLSKSGVAFAGAAGVVSEVGDGVYKIVLTGVDTNTAGDLAYFITAASGDDNTFVDQVTPTVFNDLNIDASGNVSIASSIKKNAALNGYMFLMTNSTTHVAQTGLTVTAQRSLSGAGFAPCANAVTELSHGIYAINLAATDTNANSIMYRFTATNADDLNILMLTQP